MKNTLPAIFSQYIPPHSSMQTVKEKAMYVLVAIDSFIESNQNSEIYVLSNNSMVCQLVDQYTKTIGVSQRTRVNCNGFDEYPIAKSAYELSHSTHLAMKIASSELMRGKAHYNCDSDILAMREFTAGNGITTFYPPPKHKNVFIADTTDTDEVFNSLSVNSKIDWSIVERFPWVNQGIFAVNDSYEFLSIINDTLQSFKFGLSRVFLNCVPDEVVFNACAWNIGETAYSKNLESKGMNIFPTWIYDCSRPIRSIHFAYTQRPSNIVFLKETMSKTMAPKWSPEKTIAGFRGGELTDVFIDAINEFRVIQRMIQRGEATDQAKRMFGWIASSFLWYASLWKVNDALDNWFGLPFRGSAGEDIANDIRKWMSSN